VNANVARAGFDAHGGSAAVHLARDVMPIEGTPYSHFLVGVDAAGARGCIEAEARAAGPKLYRSRAGFELPVRCWRARDLDVAGTGTGAQTAVDIAQLDRSRAGLRFYIAGTGLLGIDAAGARVDGEAALESGGVNAAGAGG